MQSCLQQTDKKLSTLGKIVKTTTEQQKRPKSTPRSYSEPLPRKYRWRKLRIAYSDSVLAMYPYLGEFDSDGDDDIAEGEEDEFVKWDPVNRVHVRRETLCESLACENKAAASESDARYELLAGDRMGLGFLLDAARAISENSLEYREGSSDDTLYPSGGYYDEADISASSKGSLDSFPELMWDVTTPQGGLSPNSSPPQPMYSSPAGHDGSDLKNDYLPTPGTERVLDVQKEDSPNESRIDPLVVKAWEMLEIHRGAYSPPQQLDSDSDSDLGGIRRYTSGDVGFGLAVDDAMNAALAAPIMSLNYQEVTWSEELTWSQVPTPQSKLSPDCSPSRPIYEAEYERVPEHGYESAVYEYPPTPGREWDLQVQKEKERLMKGQIDSFANEALQHCETPEIIISPLEEPGSETLFSDPQLSEVTETESRDKVDHQLSLNFVDVIITLLHTNNSGVLAVGEATRRRMKAYPQVPFGPNRHPSTRKSKSFHIRHNECNPVHRFHGFRRQVNTGGIKYKRNYDRLSSKSTYTPKMNLSQILAKEFTVVSRSGVFDHVGLKLGNDGLEEGEIVDGEQEVDDGEEVVTKLDRICQRHGWAPWLTMRRMIDSGFPMTMNKWEILGTEVAVMKPRAQSMCINEMVQAGYEPIKAHQMRPYQHTTASHGLHNGPPPEGCSAQKGLGHSFVQDKEAINVVASPTDFQEVPRGFSSMGQVIEEIPKTTTLDLSPKYARESSEVPRTSHGDSADDCISSLMLLKDPYHRSFPHGYGDIPTNTGDGDLSFNGRQGFSTNKKSFLREREGASRDKRLPRGHHEESVDEMNSSREYSANMTNRNTLSQNHIKGSSEDRVSRKRRRDSPGGRRSSRKYREDSDDDGDGDRRSLRKHREDSPNDRKSSRKDHVHSTNRGSSHKHHGDSISARKPSHRHREHSPDDRRRSRKYHEVSKDRSSRKHHKDSVRARKPSHKHRSHSKEFDPHRSRNHHHREDRDRDERRSRGRSRSRGRGRGRGRGRKNSRSRRGSRSKKRSKRSSRYRTSSKKDNDGRDRSRHETKVDSLDQGRGGLEYRQIYEITVNTGKISTDCKNPFSDSPVRQFMSAHQQGSVPVDLYSKLEGSRHKKTKRSHHEAEEHSPNHERHSYHRKKRQQIDHHSRDSSRESVEHKAKRHSPSASPTRKIKTNNKQEKVLVEIRPRLQDSKVSSFPKYQGGAQADIRQRLKGIYGHPKDFAGQQRKNHTDVRQRLQEGHGHSSANRFSEGPKPFFVSQKQQDPDSRLQSNRGKENVDCGGSRGKYLWDGQKYPNFKGKAGYSNTLSVEESLQLKRNGIA